jgi:hypothetical protein
MPDNCYKGDALFFNRRRKLFGRAAPDQLTCRSQPFGDSSLACNGLDICRNLKSPLLWHAAWTEHS